MSWQWTSFVVSLLVLLLWIWMRKKRNNKSANLPPGPKGVPILGNLLRLGEFPHRDLHRLAKQYGPVMYLRLGFVPTVVVSSPQAAELFLQTHDLIFASRPFTESAKFVSYKRKGCLSLNMVSSLSMDMSCLMILGKKYMKTDDDQKRFIVVLQEGMCLVALPNFADHIPHIRALDLQGLAKRMKAVSKVFDDFLEKIIDEHIHEADKGHHCGDFVDIMLSVMNSDNKEYTIEKPNIKVVVLDMIAGSMDTSSTAIEWVFSELLQNPRVMKKVQQELETVVGLDRMVDESDLMSLDYLDMVVKERLRLHPVAPLLIPRESMEDCTVYGYHVPKKSQVIVNIWAIGRDPSVWTNAEKFNPERFAGSNVDLRGRDFGFCVIWDLRIDIPNP